MLVRVAGYSKGIFNLRRGCINLGGVEGAPWSGVVIGRRGRASSSGAVVGRRWLTNSVNVIHFIGPSFAFDAVSRSFNDSSKDSLGFLRDS